MAWSLRVEIVLAEQKQLALNTRSVSRRIMNMWQTPMFWASKRAESLKSGSGLAIKHYARFFFVDCRPNLRQSKNLISFPPP